MWYTFLVEALLTFLWKLFVAAVSERVIKGLFFKLAHYLASKTDTAIDDQFVSDLETSFNEEPDSLKVKVEHK